MNNQQFRRLVLDTPSKSQNGAGSTPKPSATPGALGSRSRASIPMTPRTVKGSSGIDFARQLAERNAASAPDKKFRSSAAPKGTKLAAGYRDRTLDRTDDEEADDKAKRIKALEEAMKLGQIDRDTFEKLRDDITGGDIGATHLVKGLDRKLLERVRRGEDVLGDGQAKGDGVGDEKTAEASLDAEFEKLAEKDVAPVVREKAVKKGEMAPPPPVSGVKRSRDAILAELKAARKAAAEAKAAAQPQLGTKFRRIGEKREEPRIERDERGREVLIIVDEAGNVKRKVRKVKAEDQAVPSGLLMPEKDAKPLGMEAPELPAAPPVEEKEDDDIFEGVGAEYDPLGDAADDDEETSSEAEDGETHSQTKEQEPLQSPPSDVEPSRSPPPLDQHTATPPPASTTAPRNYFNDTTTTTTITATDPTPANPLTDPTILAALAKARPSAPSHDATTTSPTPAEQEARLARRAAMLAAADRDLEDMDLGFGGSRFEDAEEMEEGGGEKVKLSEWRGVGLGGGDDEGEGKGGDRGGGKKRKRGPKRRKGDKDSAADVMGVIERRKGG